MDVAKLIRIRLCPSMACQYGEPEDQGFGELSYRQVIQFMLITAPNRIVQVELCRNDSYGLVGIVPSQSICCKTLA